MLDMTSKEGNFCKILYATNVVNIFPPVDRKKHHGGGYLSFMVQSSSV